jgi:predicted transcriptional regulator of viral defense system
LDDFEVEIFSFNDIETILQERFGNLNEILENLVNKQVLSRIERGKFCRNNFRDENVIGTFVVKDSAIAYWSALNLHGLTEQFPNTIYIQTIHKKNDKSLFGINYKFIKIIPAKQSGIIWNGYGNHKYPITDLEKTIVDCFDMPQYCGGYAELIRAFINAPIKAAQLIRYCKIINNIAVIKRLGYLVEISGKKNMNTFIRFAKSKLNERPNLFDPLGADVGLYNTDWKLRLNISKENILDLINQQY